MSNHTYLVTRTVFADGSLFDLSCHSTDEHTTRASANAARAAWMSVAVDAVTGSGEYQIMFQSHSTLVYQSFPGEMGEPIQRFRVEYDVMHTAMALAQIAVPVS